MKVYIAAKFSDKERMRRMRRRLTSHGYDVTARWLDLPHEGDGMTGVRHEEMAKEAGKDLVDVANSDLVIVDTFSETSHGGREVELGYAIGQGIPVWVIGPVRNVFHTIANRQFVSWEQAFAQGLAFYAS